MATITKKTPSAKQPGADYGRDGMVIPQGHPEQMLEQQQQQVELVVPGSGEYDTRPLFGASAVQFIRLSMFNPLRGFSPRRLSSWIEEQEAGQLSGALRAWEAMARRDDAIVTVKGKKEDAVAMRGYALLEGAATKENQGLQAEAKSQRERLRYFWENMRCVSAWDRNVTGGFSLFTRLCVHIQSMRYGAIHFNWRITAKGLTAELEFVPGWLFENLTGELRFLGTNPSCVYGMPLDSTNWLPIAGRGIMEAASIAYGYKHLGLETWIKYCARYGMPFPIGTCPSGPQSPEWAQMKAAIKGINDDGGAVIGEGAKIELLKAEGSAGVSPSKDLVERLDRALSAMFRGGDLSTMSSTSGHGTGSNQQTGESLLIEAADCQFVSEIMQAIERKVLDYYDGEEAEALVYGQIKGPALNDAAQELRVDEFAVKYGVRLSIKDWAERHNRALADEDEPVLEPQPQAAHSAGAGDHDEGVDDDDGQAVNFDPNQPRASDGKWTDGAGVGRKGPKIKVTRGDTLGDPDKADHTLENPILGGPDKDVKPEHAVYIVPMKDGKPDYSKMQAELQLLSATGGDVASTTPPKMLVRGSPEYEAAMKKAQAELDKMNEDRKNGVNQPTPPLETRDEWLEGNPQLYKRAPRQFSDPTGVMPPGEKSPLHTDPHEGIHHPDIKAYAEAIKNSPIKTGVVKAMADGETSVKELQEMHLSENEINSIHTVLNGAPPYWTPEKVKEDAELNRKPSGLTRNTRADELRARYPGVSDDRIATIEAYRRNALQAKMMLFKYFGGEDLKRYKVIDALNEIANTATIAAGIPKVTDIPILGSRIGGALAATVGGAAKGVQEAGSIVRAGQEAGQAGKATKEGSAAAHAAPGAEHLGQEAGQGTRSASAGGSLPPEKVPVPQHAGHEGDEAMATAGEGRGASRSSSEKGGTPHEHDHEHGHEHGEGEGGGGSKKPHEEGEVPHVDPNVVQPGHKYSPNEALRRSAEKAREQAAMLTEIAYEMDDKFPTVVSVVTSTKTGDQYIDISRGVKALPKEKYLSKEMLPYVSIPSQHRWRTTNCAEFNAVNNALRKGESPSHLFVSTINVEGNTVMKPCNNCSIWMDEMKIAAEKLLP